MKLHLLPRQQNNLFNWMHCYRNKDTFQLCIKVICFNDCIAIGIKKLISLVLP